MPSPRPFRAALVLVVALLATLVGVGSAPAAQAAEIKQRVYGGVICPHLSRCPALKLTWFDANWGYLGAVRANGGGYSLKLAPGTYHLQFTDLRPSYDVKKYAPTDIAVTVNARPVAKNVKMRPGAAITGTAKGGGKALNGATVIAANQSEQSFSTTANSKGQFAIGGLPAGRYCLFTYDRAKKYVGKCTWAGGVNYGQVKNKSVQLTQRAGSLTVFVDTATGGSAPASNLTVTSKSTGQWWTARVRSGKAVFTGVFPSRYNYKYDGGGVWLGATGSVNNGKVRPNAMGFGNIRLKDRGGWIVGAVVDGAMPGPPYAYPLIPKKGQPGATVMLFDANGTKLAETTSDVDGNFTLTGAMQTQTGLTIVVDPGTSAGGYMFGGAHTGSGAATVPKECQYDRTEVDSATDAPVISVTTNQETFIGDVAVDRVAVSNKTDPCATPVAAKGHSMRRSASPQ